MILFLRLKFFFAWSLISVVSSAEYLSWTMETNLEKLDASTLPNATENDSRYEKTASINLSDSSSLIYIDPNAFHRFTILTKVIMERNRVYNFPSDKPFLVHKKIDTYRCSGCSITGIFNRTFIELPELSILELSDNKIDFVSPFAFSRNSKLNYLDLQSNRLRHFNEQGYLHQMHNIGYLMLSGNNEFNFFNNRSITGRSDTLKVFKCDGCAIEDACVILKSYSKIFELQLNNNRLRSFDCIEPKYAKEIRLSGNQVSYLRVTGRKLEHFYCAGCSMERVDQDTFRDAPMLKAIDLTKNKIHLVTADAFQKNSVLEDLKLDSNRIANLSQEFLESMPKLKNLCVDGNNFCPSYDNTKFKKTYVKRKLRKTCINKQPFEKSLADIKSATAKVLCERQVSLIRSLVFNTLDLSNQDIAFLVSDYLDNTEDIQILNVSHNSALTFYEGEPFLNHSFLEELDMSYCAVTQIYKETFVDLPRLIKIDLSYNRIKMISDFSFRFNVGLEDLILDNNEIGFLTSDALKSTEKLTRLSLNHNKNFNFEENEVFLDHSTLQEFFCDYCSIQAIFKETFSKMPNLRKLKLAFNGMKEIVPKAFEQNMHLNDMSLDGNDLQSFDVNLVNGLTELVTLCLDKNERFNYSNTEANMALRDFYRAKNLRHVSCEAQATNEYFENRFLSPVRVKAAIFKPNDQQEQKKMMLLNSLVEEKIELKSNDNAGDDYEDEQDTEYENRGLQLGSEVEAAPEPKLDEREIIKIGSFGDGNSGSRLTYTGFGLVTSLFVLFTIMVHGQ